jgi:CRISPR-associated endonuclease/helicase Cas3
MEFQLISHALDKPLTLWEHLDQVVRATRYLVSQKSLNFKGISKQQIEELSILAAACHDFGKSTSFFQEYINAAANGIEYCGNAQDKSHALISGFFGYHMAEKLLSNYQLEEHWKSFLPFSIFLAIESHHGTYKSIEEMLKSVANSDRLLEKQIYSIGQEIFKYKFYNIDLSQGSDFDLQKIGLISSKLRRFSRDYKKIPKGYDKDKWLDVQIEHRLLGLFLYSVLLEADKAYLASDNDEQYKREPIKIPPNLVDNYIKEIKGGKLIDDERNKAYKETIFNICKFPLGERLHSITLPTGLGKTLLSASWALKLRNRIERENGFSPKIIVSLPFLSIIEQTDQVYKSILGDLYDQHKDRLYIPSYSIADFKYKDGIDDNERSDNSVDFFLSIWNSEIVVSTFDQLLYSLFSLKSKYLMRFHNLFNSIIIFDEAQALPTELWKPFEKFFNKLSEVGLTHILLMSATQPDFVPGAAERVPDHERYFENRKRVELHISPEKRQFKAFLDDLPELLNRNSNKSIMIVMNTKETSKLVYKLIKEIRPAFYLSSLIVPAQRIERIAKIKDLIEKDEKVLIVTTQCVEAGVDLDVDYIIRDWAPIDSIFQVCGRCNRNGKRGTGKVEIIRLESPCGKAFSEMIYDSIALESTANSLNGIGLEIEEKQFYNIGSKYF